MGDQRVDGCDGDGRRITRRVAIGTGIAAVGVGTMWAPSASASANGPGRLLAALRAEIRGSSVQRVVKSQLLSILGQAGEQLAHGQNLECRQTLRHEFVPLLKDAGGRYGITPRAARRWSADAERLARALPGHDAGLSAGAAGKVTVFNCYSEPVTGLTVSGYAVGDIGPYSQGGAGKPPRYTPSSLVVARSKTPSRRPSPSATTGSPFRGTASPDERRCGSRTRGILRSASTMTCFCSSLSTG